MASEDYTSINSIDQECNTIKMGGHVCKTAKSILNNTLLQVGFAGL